MTRDLRVLVLTTESRAISNELWRGAQEHVRDLLLVGESTTLETWHSNYIGLRPVELTGNHSARTLLGLNTVIRRFRPDLIHVNNELWSLSLLSRVPHRATLVAHGAENIWQKPSKIQTAVHRGLTALALRHLDGYASWNEAGRVWIAARTDIPTLTFPAIIPSQEYREVTWSPTPAEPFRILLAGSLSRLKGFDVVLNALSRDRSRLRFAVTVCGTGPELPRLRQLSEDHGIDVAFMGQVQAPEMARLMSRSHLLIQPSRDTPELVEQFGRSVAEAMTIGTPAVVSDSGELPRLVERADLVFTQDRPDELLALIHGLATSPSRLQQISTDLKNRSVKWSASTGGQTMADFWEACRDHHEHAPATPALR